MLARLKISKSMRESRNYVGGLTGFLFFLTNILKVPLRKLFNGLGAPVGMALLGLLIFVYKLTQNYQREDVNNDYKKITNKSSVSLIAEKLNNTRQKTEQFLRDYLEMDDIEENAIRLTAHELSNILNIEFLNKLRQSRTSSHYAIEFLDCSAVALMQVANHYMECLLAKGLYNPELFNLQEVSADNMLLLVIGLIAVYNAFQDFLEKYKSYEIPTHDELCEQFLNTYHGFSV